jgi:hypothetical protein
LSGELWAIPHDKAFGRSACQSRGQGILIPLLEKNADVQGRPAYVKVGLARGTTLSWSYNLKHRVFAAANHAPKVQIWQWPVRQLIAYQLGRPV